MSQQCVFEGICYELMPLILEEVVVVGQGCHFPSHPLGIGHESFDVSSLGHAVLDAGVA